jgi:prepilin signal peptidase PulO-like enzyme (type II secretory pathway)
MDVLVALRLTLLFVVGACLGSLVNWAIYSLAWNARPISPWSSAPEGAPRRSWFDRVPILGWITLSREAAIHGRWFWVRPLLLEISVGVALAALYWWEIEQLGLVRGQLPGALAPPLGPLYCQLFSHALLLCLMLAASFIDFDERTIPDEIAVPGTILGLALATMMPTSLLPLVTPRPVPPIAGVEIGIVNGQTWWLEPMTAVSPQPWPPAWGVAEEWRSLAIALGCFWLWCFALTPRIWRGRRGRLFALSLIAARVRRQLWRRPLRGILVMGTAAVVFTWALGGHANWAGMLSALIGMAGLGLFVWGVRIMCSTALRVEALGFGDVTLMMMIGTFIGWQAGVIAFFIAPLAGLVIGIAQYILIRDNAIPYGPFLCLASAIVVVGWSCFWNRLQLLFEWGWLVPAALAVCLVLMWAMLTIWFAIKSAIFGRRE